MTVKAKNSSRGRRGCLTALLIVLVLLAVAGGIGWSFVAREHREAANVPLNAVDFARLNDGTYHGTYTGGIYKWRVNECNVTVEGGKVTDIQLVKSIDTAAENTNAEMLYERVIKAQSLQVDTISSSTLTSKAYLKAVENALIQAQQ